MNGRRDRGHVRPGPSGAQNAAAHAPRARDRSAYAPAVAQPVL